jgi:hypothetical protein
LQGLPKEKRDITFYKLAAKAYIRENKYAIAIKIYASLEKQYPYPEEIWKYRIVVCCAYLYNEAKMLQYLTTYLEEKSFDEVKDITYSPAFDAYHEYEEVEKRKTWCEIF